MQLHELRSPKGSRKRKKIVGRGRGSGHGQTSCRGENGQKSRAGRATIGSSEGGQMPLIRRLPKIGFRSKRPILNQVVNIDSLNAFEKGAVINKETLKQKGLISSLNKPFKILAKGSVKTAVIVQVRSISKSAHDKILEVGGKVEIIQAEKAQDNSSKKTSKKQA